MVDATLQTPVPKVDTRLILTEGIYTNSPDSKSPVLNVCLFCLLAGLFSVYSECKYCPVFCNKSYGKHLSLGDEVSPNALEGPRETKMWAHRLEKYGVWLVGTAPRATQIDDSRLVCRLEHKFVVENREELAPRSTLHVVKRMNLRPYSHVVATTHSTYIRAALHLLGNGLLFSLRLYLYLQAGHLLLQCTRATFKKQRALFS